MHSYSMNPKISLRKKSQNVQNEDYMLKPISPFTDSSVRQNYLEADSVFPFYYFDYSDSQTNLDFTRK